MSAEDKNPCNRETHPEQEHGENQRIGYANMKRTYDAYQDLDLAKGREAQVEQSQLHSVALQALQNAVETANQVAKSATTTLDMTAKQAIRHSDIAIDAQWNPVQQGTADNITGRTVMDSAVASKAVDAAVAKQLDATISPVVAILADMVKALSQVTAELAAKQQQ